jgi:vancomycin resistance protein YoaR
MLQNPHLLLKQTPILRAFVPMQAMTAVIIQIHLGKRIYVKINMDLNVGSRANLKWISMVGMLLLFHQVYAPDHLTINHQGQSAIIINRAEYKLLALPLIDLDKFNQLLNVIERQIYQLPHNAKIGDHGEIIPEQIGYKLDRRKFTTQFYTYFFGSGPSTFDVPRTAIYPNVDSELLAHIREKPLSHYISYFNSGNKNRSHNIALAAKAINNFVVFPGEIFSFNQVVGKRTKEKGYLIASVIVRGELSEGIGGGICQVSSTLFNAIDGAGLRIVQRYSHSRNVPYVLHGRDATVSWAGPDFLFKNQYNQPILILAYSEGGSMFVKIYSSDVIEYKPRVVPSMSKRLPEEISLDSFLMKKSRMHHGV